MPILTLKFKDNVIKEYDLEKGKSLSIGRREGNNIVIDNLAVSGHHAKIDSVGEGFLVTDLQSKNGSFVNEQFISTHWLKHGDVITIGKHSIVFAYKDGEARPETASPQENMDQTMVMDTNSYKSMLAKSSPNATSPDIAKTQVKEPVGVLSYVAGGQGEVEISKKLFKIGKAFSKLLTSPSSNVRTTVFLGIDLSLFIISISLSKLITLYLCPFKKFNCFSKLSTVTQIFSYLSPTPTL